MSENFVYTFLIIQLVVVEHVLWDKLHPNPVDAYDWLLDGFMFVATYGFVVSALFWVWRS